MTLNNTFQQSQPGGNSLQVGPVGSPTLPPSLIVIQSTVLACHQGKKNVVPIRNRGDLNGAPGSDDGTTLVSFRRVRIFAVGAATGAAPRQFLPVPVTLAPESYLSEMPEPPHPQMCLYQGRG